MINIAQHEHFLNPKLLVILKETAGLYESVYEEPFSDIDKNIEDLELNDLTSDMLSSDVRILKNLQSFEKEYINLYILGNETDPALMKISQRDHISLESRYNNHSLFLNPKLVEALNISRTFEELMHQMCDCPWNHYNSLDEFEKFKIEKRKFYLSKPPGSKEPEEYYPQWIFDTIDHLTPYEIAYINNNLFHRYASVMIEPLDNNQVDILNRLQRYNQGQHNK